jgi:dipeptidyl-peptidase 4
MTRGRWIGVATAAACAWVAVGVAQAPSTLDEELRAIFERNEYRPAAFGPAAWLETGARYTTVEAAGSSGKEIVAYDASSGQREVIVPASALTPSGATSPLTIDGYSWSRDRSLLLFTNTKRVWRQNTRGDYWVLRQGQLRKLGGDAPASTLMFAKFSPDGARVAYVRENNLYVEDVASGTIRQLTRDGSETIINGTSDWVYEEEFGLRDGFRWSPDSRHIAFWQFDTAAIEFFTLINNTDTLYPKVTRYRYPKAGTTNSRVRIGVVDAADGAARWMDVVGDPRDSYIPRMEWADATSLIVQHVNRLQNRNDVLLADAASGKVTRVHRDEAKTWLQVVDEVEWLPQRREFLWVSEKDGWRHAYAVARDGSRERLVTAFEGDLTDVAGIDGERGYLYFIASPDSATERYLYRARLDGTGGVERVTPRDQQGTHSYDVSPGGGWAFHTWSRLDRPPSVELIRLPDHRAVRVLADNSALQSKLARLAPSPTEFFKLDIGGLTVDGWMIAPRNFDPSRKYPVVVYVYGEPAGQTVADRWGGNRQLFHRALANDGYVVVSFDNRGTPAPRGAAWRKVVYGSVGDLSSKEQAAAVRAFIASRPFLDPARVGVWGASGGGTNTLNAMFRFPDVYKVGVSVAPVPDQRLYDTIYQERYMGLPQDNVEGYRIGSAINFAEGLRGKLLVVHGTGDDNVHYQGSERLANRLIELGKPFDLMVYPNRTHAISEGTGTQLHLYSLIARYFKEHLPASGGSAMPTAAR